MKMRKVAIYARDLHPGFMWSEEEVDNTSTTHMILSIDLLNKEAKLFCCTFKANKKTRLWEQTCSTLVPFLENAYWFVPSLDQPKNEHSVGL